MGEDNTISGMKLDNIPAHQKMCLPTEAQGSEVKPTSIKSQIHRCEMAKRSQLRS